jgi:hypothetical protein
MPWADNAIQHYLSLELHQWRTHFGTLSSKYVDILNVDELYSKSQISILDDPYVSRDTLIHNVQIVQHNSLCQIHGNRRRKLRERISQQIKRIEKNRVAGRLAELQWSSNSLLMFASFVLSTAVIYGLGVPVLAMNAFGSDLAAATNYMLPYLVWDAAKAVIAAGLLPGAWLLVNKLTK